MRCRMFLITAIMLLAAPPAFSSEITDQFTRAFEEHDRATMEEIVKKNNLKIPAEIQSMIEQAAKAEPGEKESKYFLAEEMAIVYRDVTGDTALLKETKKKSFDSRLSQPVRAQITDGVYTVVLPKPDGSTKNMFRPDNIIIKAGGTVRWLNNDAIAHVFSSMPVIGAGGLFTQEIQPGASWEYKFDKPGDYYYICFIHRVMIGKIIVEE